MLKYAERVRETTSNKPVAGGTSNLSGAKVGFRTAVAGLGTLAKSVFCAEKVDVNGNPSGAWEVFVGTVTDAAPDTISRDYLIDSPTGSFIDWSAAGEDSSPEIFCVHPAAIGHQGPLQIDDLWLSMPVNMTAGSANVTQDRLYAMPIVIAEPCLLTDLRVDNTSAVSGQRFNLGIYKDAGGMPGARLTTGVEVTGDAIGIKTGTFGTPIFLTPGRHWLACWVKLNGGLRGFTPGALGHQLGAAFYGVSATSMVESNVWGGYSNVVGAYSTTLPNPFGTLNAPISNGANYPLMNYKLDFL